MQSAIMSRKDVCSDEFLEDGIPHVQMMLELPALREKDR